MEGIVISKDELQQDLETFVWRTKQGEVFLIPYKDSTIQFGNGKIPGMALLKLYGSPDATDQAEAPTS